MREPDAVPRHPLYFDLNAPLVVVDVETTGHSPENGYIIEIGMVRVEQKQITDTYETLIRTPVPVPPFIQELTGLSDEDLCRAPEFGEAQLAIRDFIGEATLVAHNAPFDYRFLKKEFERAGQFFYANRLCTVRLCRKLFPALKHYNLDRLADYFGITIHPRHRALGDARATAEILIRCLNHPEALKVFSQMAAGWASRAIWMERLEPLIQELPDHCGVYIFADANGLPLYIGKSNRIRSRILSHLREDNLPKKQRLLHHTHHFQWQECKTELEALILESRLIKQYAPPYNIQQRNWRQYVFLSVSKDPYPVITVTNQRTAANCYGPYRSKKLVGHYLEKIRKLYKLCPELMKAGPPPGRFCFSYHLGQCAGACGGAIRPEVYQQTVKEAVELLDELLKVDSGNRIDLFLRQPELKEPKFYYVREGLKSLKQHQKFYPETFSRKYLIVNPSEETGYLIVNGLLKKIFRGEELQEPSQIREAADCTEVGAVEDKETLDERLIIEKYVHTHRHKLKIINLAT